jgi:hypothetical protein
VCVILNGLNTTNRNSCLPLTLFTCGAQYDWRMGIAQKASQSRWWMSIPAMVIQTVRGVDELMKAMVPQWCFFCTWTLRRPQNGKCGKCTKMFGSEKTHTQTIYICMYIYIILYIIIIYIHAYIHLEALGTMKRDEDVFRTSRFNQMFIAVFFLLKCISGWWFQPSWKILVSWDDYSQHMEKEKNVPNNQPNMVTSGKMS